MNVNSTAAKLLITPGTSLWFTPIEWLWMLGPLPPAVSMTAEFAGATVAVMYVSNEASMRWFLNRHRTMLTMPRVVWLCYPTRGRPDFNRSRLVQMAAAAGLHPADEVPLDGGWTALRFAAFGGRPGPR